jgi:hypothetical protein
MDAHNFLFWFSLATGVIALGAITMFRFARSPRAQNSPQVTELPLDTE